jgi:hypothetical protein
LLDLSALRRTPVTPGGRHLPQAVTGTRPLRKTCIEKQRVDLISARHASCIHQVQIPVTNS